MPTFIEEQTEMVESRKQIVEIFIERREFIKPHGNIAKLKNNPILVEGEKAEIAELEKPSKTKFEGRKSVNYINHKAVRLN